MIKLSKIYSNNNTIFPEIKFRDGLNIIFGSVTKELEDKSSHSLGKTLLIDLIDYCLLKETRSDFFLNKNQFNNFTFYLELKINLNKFVTVERVVNGKISIAEHIGIKDYATDDDASWIIRHSATKPAKQELNNLINPTLLENHEFNYRSGLRYCFRKQTQYEDAFKVNSSREADVNWKPYLAGILGITPEIVRKKYDSNKKVENIKNAVKEIKELPEDSSQGLEAEIAQIESTTSRMKRELDKFDFTRSDEVVSKELVEDVNQKIVNLNKILYSIDQRLIAINNSLLMKFNFDLDKVIELFEDVKIYFPEELLHSYDELIQLNTEMSSGRRERLKKLKVNLLCTRQKP